MIKLQYKKKGRQSCTQNEHTIVGHYDQKLCQAQICTWSCAHFGVRCAASFAGGHVGVVVCCVTVLTSVPAGVHCISVVPVFAAHGAEGTRTLP